MFEPFGNLTFKTRSRGSRWPTRPWRWSGQDWWSLRPSSPKRRWA